MRRVGPLTSCACAVGLPGAMASRAQSALSVDLDVDAAGVQSVRSIDVDVELFVDLVLEGAGGTSFHSVRTVTFFDDAGVVVEQVGDGEVLAGTLAHYGSPMAFDLAAFQLISVGTPLEVSGRNIVAPHPFWGSTGWTEFSSGTQAASELSSASSQRGVITTALRGPAGGSKRTVTTRSSGATPLRPSKSRSPRECWSQTSGRSVTSTTSPGIAKGRSTAPSAPRNWFVVPGITLQLAAAGSGSAAIASQMHAPPALSQPDAVASRGELTTASIAPRRLGTSSAGGVPLGASASSSAPTLQ